MRLSSGGIRDEVVAFDGGLRVELATDLMNFSFLYSSTYFELPYKMGKSQHGNGLLIASLTLHLGMKLFACLIFPFGFVFQAWHKELGKFQVFGAASLIAHRISGTRAPTGENSVFNSVSYRTVVIADLLDAQLERSYRHLLAPNAFSLA